jgi:hypothetical protein
MTLLILPKSRKTSCGNRFHLTNATRDRKAFPSLARARSIRFPKPDIVVDPFEIPVHCIRAYGLDVGWRRTAAIWGALDPDTDVFLYWDILNEVVNCNGFRTYCSWTVETSIKWGRELEGVLEYLEDPCRTQEGMATVRRALKTPLATNMCTTSFDDLPGSARAGSEDIILTDHHFWAGCAPRWNLRRTAALSAAGVDAFEQPRRDLADRNDAPWRRDAESHLRPRHPLSLAVGGNHRRRPREV